jgi:hypothetical protein
MKSNKRKNKIKMMGGFGFELAVDGRTDGLVLHFYWVRPSMQMQVPTVDRGTKSSYSLSAQSLSRECTALHHLLVGGLSKGYFPEGPCSPMALANDEATRVNAYPSLLRFHGPLRIFGGC